MIGLRIGRKYARALLAIGKEDGKYREYAKELEEIDRLLEREEDAKLVLTSPRYSRDIQKKILNNILAKIQFSDTIKSLLNVLVEKRRLQFIGEINLLYRKLLDEFLNIERAKVISAVSLPEESIGKVRETLEKMTGKSIIVEVEEDPSIIGGIVAKVGDLVLDGSLRAQLMSLKDTLRGEI